MNTKALFLTSLITASIAAAIGAATAVSLSAPSAHIDNDQSVPVKQIKELREQLNKQKELTSKLQQRLQEISNSQARSVATAAAQTTSGNDDQANELESTEIVENVQEQRQRGIGATSRNDFRRQNLLDNGFAEDEANWVLRNEAEVQLDSLYEQYRARRAQTEINNKNGTRAKSRAEQLKERLGEDVYERYLEANGFPTSVGVSSVLADSPGANAGLRAGDRILRYDGHRVFNIRELNGLTEMGEEGKSVLIEVERDGNPVQVTLPRGPIGITGGRGRF